MADISNQGSTTLFGHPENGFDDHGTKKGGSRLGRLRSSGSIASLLKSARRKSSESLRSSRSSLSMTSDPRRRGDDHGSRGYGCAGGEEGDGRDEAVHASLHPSQPPPPPAKDSIAGSTPNVAILPSMRTRASAATLPQTLKEDEGETATGAGESEPSAVALGTQPPSPLGTSAALRGDPMETSQRQAAGADASAQEADGTRTPTGRTTPTQSNPRGTAQSTVPPLQQQQQQQQPTASQGGDGNTIAQLYTVLGLPKQPTSWTLAEEDCVAGVQHMEDAVDCFWRPEVLGCSICPSPADVLAQQQRGELASSRGDGASGKKSASGSNPKYIEMADGRGRIEKAETARVLSKALKLSFSREIEIVAGHSNNPPTATSHTFSFSVPTVSPAGGQLLDRQGGGNSSTDSRMGTGAIGVSHQKTAAATGEGFGLASSMGNTMNGGRGAGAGVGHEENPAPATFYGVCLTVWSAADERRTKAIKKELSRASRHSRKERKAKGSGKKVDEGNESWLPSAGGGGSSAVDEAFFMPYAICIISRYPLYDLLGDWNKWAWNKYSRNIEMHNKLMSTILAKPAPRLGTMTIVESPDKDLAFSCVFPGALEWGTGLIGHNVTMWPLFRTLSLSNILTICEIALAPNGRVLFHSRHPALLGLAVETIKYLVELRGWQGVANQTCHARDVKIYLEDPGSWLIGIATELRSIVRLAPSVCIVDLDLDSVRCEAPPKGAPSSRGLRERRLKKLSGALGFSNGDFRPPREIIEAYPSGRFRPLTSLQCPTPFPPYEQLERPSWWDQTKVLTTFDKVLHDGKATSALGRLLKLRAKKGRGVSEEELAAILALRKRASTFVDARDGLENKIGRLNKRLAFLMSESEMWKAQFSKIQQLVDRLTKEANDTRAKLDKERRESRRLSSTLAQRDLERVQLQLQLKETENARTAAQSELTTMQRTMDDLEMEREAMIQELHGIISGATGDDGYELPLTDSSRPGMFGSSTQGHGSSRPCSPSGSQASSNMTPSQTAERILRARKAAEERINRGPAVRSRSQLGLDANGGGGNGLSVDHSSSIGHSSSNQGAHRASPPPAAPSTGSHFHNDDQMNYEMQRRTAGVTDQIARIQAQLENTLSGLEDRSRSGHRARRRRGSDATSSLAGGHRHEFGAPSSSLGGGHSVMDSDNGSVSQHGGTRGTLEGGGGGAGSEADHSYLMHDAARRERREERRRQREARKKEAAAAGSGGPPSAYRGPVIVTTNGDGKIKNSSSKVAPASSDVEGPMSSQTIESAEVPDSSVSQRSPGASEPASGSQK